MQPVDYTTLTAACSSLRSHWMPARLEQVYQIDRHTIALGLRTLTQKGWLTIAWHPQAARICLGDSPPRIPDTFTFSEQLRHQLNGKALSAIKAMAPWERVVDLQFAGRPGEKPHYHLYVEIMGKYSNVILTDAKDQIITVAYQVTANKSSLRTVETGQPYQLPPPLTGTTPKLNESLVSWQERVSLIPGKIAQQLLKAYRGLSPAVVRGMIEQANLDPQQSTDSLTVKDWEHLYEYWLLWLEAIATEKFQPGWTESGYTVLGWGMTKEASNVHSLLNSYYQTQLQQQAFQQLRHQLGQKIAHFLSKLKTKADLYQQRLQQSAQAEEYRQKGDLLMAHLSQWQPGMKSITLQDFETGKPIQITLEPEKNAIQNAQALYKQHQKRKRARGAVEPLLREVQAEIKYLQQVQATLTQLETYATLEDLQTLAEIKEELIAQKYLEDTHYRKSPPQLESQPYSYHSPSGFEVLIGRNNRQNERLTFRTAGDYDLWFHTQEIPGSHVLLRLTPGAVPEPADLDFTANLAAYYSQARESEQVPVIYTEPKYVYKPKGAKPGMAIYKRERLLWGRPQIAKIYLSKK
jgi:predicted ribosome quality control (RQC) complex YloA/Tae2 family protein